MLRALYHVQHSRSVGRVNRGEKVCARQWRILIESENAARLRAGPDLPRLEIPIPNAQSSRRGQERQDVPLHREQIFCAA